MLTTSALTYAMEAVLTELSTHCRLIGLAGPEMDEFFLGARDQLVDS